MSDSSRPKRFLSRRRFFKHTAALASLSALPLLRSSKLDEQAFPASAAAGRIALLLPQSSTRASAAERFLAGWHSGLNADSGVEVERYTSPHDALVRIERLAGQDDVALVTGFVSYQHAVGLGPALQKLGTP
ncbi:MAG TPA: hypothetical protein VFT99_02190, partial [Roseiflexaceae bacterium]|nr:hypothetical protein [Roseiflexaceae bacterium]